MLVDNAINNSIVFPQNIFTHLIKYILLQYHDSLIKYLKKKYSELLTE